MKIEIKNRYNSSVIFSHECENNKLKLMVELAIKSKISLSWADLSRADLSGANLSRADLSRADLSWADLSGADLSWADLSGANLSGANLSRADLSRADLSWADLSWADLSGANFRNSTGNMIEIRSMQLDKWKIAFTKDILAIGCQQHTIEEWRNFSDEQIAEMDNSALKWWKKWKEFIFKSIELSIGE